MLPHGREPLRTSRDELYYSISVFPCQHLFFFFCIISFPAVRARFEAPVTFCAPRNEADIYFDEEETSHDHGEAAAGRRRAPKEDNNKMAYERTSGNPLDRLDESMLRMILSENFGGEAPAGAAGGERPSGPSRNGRAGNGGGAFRLPALEGAPLAMVYSPQQKWEDVYDPEKGLERGTIFAALDLPFYPAACGGCAVQR